MADVPLPTIDPTTPILAPTVSPAGSISGYSLKKWLAGSKEGFKLLGSAGLGVVTYYITSSSLAPALADSLTVLCTAAAKWAFDLVDFWLSDVDLQK